MVRDRKTARFIYTERLERRGGESSWAYARRIVRREGKLREFYTGETLEIFVGWGVGSIEQLLEDYPEYRNPPHGVSECSEEDEEDEEDEERTEPVG